MNYSEVISINDQRLQVRSLLPKTGIEVVREEIIAGLRSEPKQISSKFFYNALGSELYEQITELEEYYPARTEKAILKNIAGELMESCKGFDIIELGPGDPTKICNFLDAVRNEENVHYLPMDISKSAIEKLSGYLVDRYPNLEVDAWVMDFTYQFGMLQRENPALICFFGSTIGNFTREKGLTFVRKLASDMKPGSRLLMGVDMIKDEAVLHAAYNDEKGVTAEFNLNILEVVNEILGCNINKEDFEHLAFFNKDESRIEMHLVAKKDLIVVSPYLQEPIQLKKGERIHTENSHKFSQKHIKEFTEGTGLRVCKVYSDEQGWFSLVEFEKISN